MNLSWTEVCVNGPNYEKKSQISHIGAVKIRADKVALLN